MLINIKVGTKPCAIKVERDCFIPIVYGINQKEDSVNYGKPTEQQLGFYSGYNAFSRAVLSLIQATNASEEDTTTIKEYCERVEAVEKSVMEQLQGWDRLRKEV